jgi:hypothetical protein
MRARLTDGQTLSFHGEAVLTSKCGVFECYGFLIQPGCSVEVFAPKLGPALVITAVPGESGKSTGHILIIKPTAAFGSVESSGKDLESIPGFEPVRLGGEKNHAESHLC